MTVRKYDIIVTIVAIFLIVLSFQVGHRSLNSGADTYSYVRSYLETSWCQCQGSRELGFELFSILFAKIGAGSEEFLTALSLISFSLLLYFSHSMSDDLVHSGMITQWARWGVMLFLVGVMLISPMTLSAQLNGLRQGISAFALSVFVFEMSRRNRIHSFFFAMIAIAFHYSAALYILSILAVSIAAPLLNPRRVMLVVVAFFALYVSGLSEVIVRIALPPVYDFVNNYGLDVAYRLRSGIRVDFAIFTISILALAYFLLQRTPEQMRTKYGAYFSLAATSSIPFFLLGWGFFSNRYLFTTWILLVALVGTILASILVRARLINIAAPIMFVAGASAFLYQMEHL